MFIGAYVRYKVYEGSMRANILVMIGAFFKMISLMCLFMIIVLLTVRNPNVEYHLSIAIPIIVGIGLAFFIIGIFLNRKAEEVGILDFDKKIRSDLEFAKKMVKIKPENKSIYMNLNTKYDEYVLLGKEELEKTMKKSNKNKINDMIRNIVGIPLLILILVSMFYFIRSL